MGGCGGEETRRGEQKGDTERERHRSEIERPIERERHRSGPERESKAPI